MMSPGSVISIPHVLHVMRPAAGGMLTHLELLLKGLGRAGFELTAACPVDELVLQHMRAAGIARILPLDVGDAVRPLADPLIIGRFSRFLEEHPFDIIHAHGAKAGLITRLALNWRRRLPYPVIVSYHNEILPESRHVRQRRMRYLAERCLAGSTSHFIAVSPPIKEELITVIGCSPDQVSLIPNGIELPEPESQEDWTAVRRTCRLRWGWPDETDGFIVGTACRLTWEKGPDLLIKAAELALARERSLRFVIIGDGPMAEELRQVARNLGILPFVRFLGYQRDARQLFPAFDAFVLPSRTEGWPLSLMEAMAVGLPVVAAGTGGAAYMVESGRTGILVRPGNAEELAEALILLARNKELAEKLGRAAAHHAYCHFSAEAMVARVKEVYDEVLSQTSSASLLREGGK